MHISCWCVGCVAVYILTEPSKQNGILNKLSIKKFHFRLSFGLSYETRNGSSMKSEITAALRHKYRKKTWNAEWIYQNISSIQKYPIYDCLIVDLKSGWLTIVSGSRRNYIKFCFFLCINFSLLILYFITIPIF